MLHTSRRTQGEERVAEAYRATTEAQAASQAARAAQHEAEERARVAERALAVANEQASSAAEAEAAATRDLTAVRGDLATARASNDALAAQLAQVRGLSQQQPQWQCRVGGCGVQLAPLGACRSGVFAPSLPPAQPDPTCRHAVVAFVYVAAHPYLPPSRCCPFLLHPPPPPARTGAAQRGGASRISRRRHSPRVQRTGGVGQQRGEGCGTAGGG